MPKRKRTEPAYVDFDDDDLADKYGDRGLQQDDNYREKMGFITEGGLLYAYKMIHDPANATQFYQKKVPADKVQHVIIVGGGISGLTAAYELAQVGHKVTILEAQSRVGGRVKTFTKGFFEGLHVDGGAMRLPYNHYLTRHYIKLFGVERDRFQNYNENGFMFMYGTKITFKVWTNNNRKYTDLWWPGWDANWQDWDKKIQKKHNVEGILDLYRRTMEPVVKELGESPTEKEWQTWVAKWSKLSVEDFLRSTYFQSPTGPQYRPWTEKAIEAYKVSSYMPTTGSDLASFLREDLGQWWQEPMYTPKYGMSSIPWAFMKRNERGWNDEVDLSKNIVFGVMAKIIEGPEQCGKGVKVYCMNIDTGKEHVYTGDSVIVTVPLNIMRQMDIAPLCDSRRRAIADITYSASTKIMLQCKTRFWQPEVGQGGFSKTNLPIGQVHYPDYNGSGIGDDERGILLVYTWGKDALMFGAETKWLAIQSAVHQIAKIHPEIKDQFEVGDVQAWYSDPYSQGAYAGLKPFEYNDAMKLLTTPINNVYLAGEALSWTNGWIQGAMFSGLSQAYALIENSMNVSAKSKPTCPFRLLHS